MFSNASYFGRILGRVFLIYDTRLYVKGRAEEPGTPAGLTLSLYSRNNLVTHDEGLNWVKTSNYIGNKKKRKTQPE